jgi:hypothetical protein
MAMGSDGGAAQTTRDYVRPARVQLGWSTKPHPIFDRTLAPLRAWISSRSNSAIAAKILMVKRPLGVVVSTAVLSLTARLAPRCRPPKNGAIDHPQPGADKVDSAEGMATLGGDEQSSQLPPRAAEQAGVRATDCRAG